MNLQTSLSLISILVGSGAVGYVIRLLIRISVLETLFEEKKEDVEGLVLEQNKFGLRLSLIESAVSDIRSIVEDVRSSGRKLIEINGQLVQISEAVKYIVPRTEVEYHWRAYDQNVLDTKEVVKRLEEKIESLKHQQRTQHN